MAVLDPNISYDYLKMVMLAGLSIEVSFCMYWFGGSTVQECLSVLVIVMFVSHLILVILHTVQDMFECHERQFVRYKNLTGHLRSTFIVLDQDMKILFMNKTFLDYKPHEIVGTSIRNLPFFEEEFFRNLTKTRTNNQCKWKWNVDNQVKWYIIDAQIQNEIGNNFEISMLIHDISDQESSVALKAKNEFIASISHEVRNPLQIIMYSVENLLTESLEKKIEETVKDIDLSTKLLTTIIGDILDYSKIEAGELKIQETKFEILEVVESSILMYLPSCIKKGLKWKLIFDFSLPKFMQGDPSRILQIMNNYLSNAIKYTETGTITITAKRIKTKDYNEEFYYECRDTGIGISEVDMFRLFDPFIQLDSSRIPTNFKGWGLGLSICKKLISMMNGRFGVERNQVGGASFWFTIPLVGNIYGTLKEDMKIAKWIKNEVSICHSDPAVVSLIKDSLSNSSIAIQDFDPKKVNFNQILFVESQLIDLIPKSFNKDQVVILHASEFMTFKALRYPILPSSLYKILLEGNKHFDIKQTNNVTQSYDKLRILVVDDNRLILKSMERLLQKIGVLIVERAEDGKQAYEMVCKMNEFHLIFMDISMPVMDGIEATKLIRELGGKKSKSSIVALTGNALLKSKEELCEEWKMDHIISKPVNMNDLLTSLTNLQNRSLQQT